MSAGLAKLVIAVTVALLGGAAAWFGYPRQPVPVPPSAIATPPDASKSASLALPPADPGPATETASGPTFDVVRVEPNGDSVIAGRAAPGATIDLLRNGEPLARVVADATGLFAIVPPALAPGSHEITLRAIGPDGARSRSAQSVTVVVAARRSEPPLVTVTAPDQPTVVLSRPDAPAGPPANPGTVASSGAASSGASASGTPASPGAPRPQVKIATVETQGDGRLMVSGLGAPGATLRLYLNDAFVAPGATAKDGKLAFSIERGIRAGNYRVRLDDVDPVTGQVRSRVEVPFTVPAPVVASAPNLPGSPRPPERPGDAAGSGAAMVASAGPAALPAPEGRVVVPEVNTAIVVRGETLWRISKRVYGQGLRYTVIYGANTPQIRNPDLIYPGQLFVLPAEPQGKTR